MHSWNRCSQQLQQQQAKPLSNQSQDGMMALNVTSNSQHNDRDDKHSRWTRRQRKENANTAPVDTAYADRNSQSKKEEGAKSYLNVRNIFSHAKNVEREYVQLSDKDTRRLSLNSSTSSTIQPNMTSSDISTDDSLGSIVRWHSKRRSHADSAYGSLNFLTDEKDMAHDDATSEMQGMQQTLLEIRDVLNDRPALVKIQKSPPPPLRMMPSKSTPTLRTSTLEVESTVSHRSASDKNLGKAVQGTSCSPGDNHKQQRERVALRDEEGTVIAQYVSRADKY